MNQAKKVLMIADAHGIQDDRIYWKEGLSLKRHGYEVHCIGTGDSIVNTVSDEGIYLHQITNPVFIKNRIINKLFKSVFRKNTNLKILQIVREIKPDICHIHDLKPLALVKQLKKRYSTK
ncbi:glycosyltransferase, partial [Bacteroidota bacterium]